MINAKYNLDVPLYRYAKYLNSQGIPLSDMDLTNYVKRSDELLSPLYEAIKDRLINQTANVIHSDETPLEVLDYLRSGFSVAIVTDRGTPIISDPGYKTVKYISESSASGNANVITCFRLTGFRIYYFSKN